MRRPLERRDSLQVIQVVILFVAQIKLSRHSILNLKLQFCKDSPLRWSLLHRLLVYLLCLSKFSDSGIFKTLPAGC